MLQKVPFFSNVGAQFAPDTYNPTETVLRVVGGVSRSTGAYGLVPSVWAISRLGAGRLLIPACTLRLMVPGTRTLSMNTRVRGHFSYREVTGEGEKYTRRLTRTWWINQSELVRLNLD
jgi:hypothetical protein